MDATTPTTFPPEGSPTRELPGFLRSWALFIALQLPIMIAVLVICHYHSDNYLLANIDKERYLREAPGKRAIFVGGSGVAFSLDNDVIRPRLARLGYEPVNMGIFVGLGLPYMLNQTADGVREGDLVVLILEHEVFIKEDQFEGEANWASYVPANPRDFAYLRPRHYREFFRRQKPLDVAASYVREAVKPSPLGSIYARHRFDYSGSLMKERPASYFKDPSMNVWQERDDVYQWALAAVREFVSTCEGRGARVVMMMPAYPDFMLAANRELILDNEKRLAQDLNIPILLGVEESLLPQSDFYDTQYHLTNAGVDLRSDLVSRKLEAYLESAPAKP